MPENKIGGDRTACATCKHWLLCETKETWGDWAFYECVKCHKSYLQIYFMAGKVEQLAIPMYCPVRTALRLATHASTAHLGRSECIACVTRVTLEEQAARMKIYRQRKENFRSMCHAKNKIK